MAKYQEKRDPLYVDILPATRDHVAVQALPVRPEEKDLEMYVIGELNMPDGLVPVWNNDVIVDYGDKATPRYVRMPAADVSAFFERPTAPKREAKKPELPADSSAEPVKVPAEGGGE